MARIKVVIGANYGDEGKGLATAYFASEAGDSLTIPLIVLSNGGAQRGHTVETRNGDRHVFHHFGSHVAAQPVCTYIPAQFCVNPIVFASEGEALRHRDGRLHVCVNPDSPVTTPYDMMVNQIEELSRGDRRHGSTGMGYWATLRRQEDCPIFFRDVMSEGAMTRKLADARDYTLGFIEKSGMGIPIEYIGLFKDTNLFHRYLEDAERMRELCHVADDGILRHFEDVVFENAQGLLLSSNASDLHTTPSCTGIGNVNAIVESSGVDISDAEICYVTRSYLTRHGAGPLPGECPVEFINDDIRDETNQPNPWQGSLRFGMLDIDGLNARVNADVAKNRLNALRSVMLTHSVEHRKPNGEIEGLLRYAPTKFVEDVAWCWLSK